MSLTRGRIVFYGHLTQLRQGIDAPSDSIFEHIDLGRPPISLALRKCGDKLGALRFRETVRIAGYVVHGVIQLLIAGGSDDVRRFDPEGARHRGDRGRPRQPPLTYLLTEAGVRPAASASSF